VRCCTESDDIGVIGIVLGLRGGGPDVVVRDVEDALERVLQLEAGVIGTQRRAHRRRTVTSGERFAGRGSAAAGSRGSAALPALGRSAPLFAALQAA
jgi:hypothetical protein